MQDERIPRYQALARCLDHLRRVDGNPTFALAKEASSMRLERLMNDAPSGSGFDTGTTIEIGRSGALVFQTAFHHMDDIGYYDGWTDHTVRIKPSLAWGFEITVSGRNINDIKDYIAEVFDIWLREPVNY